ncbi:MAG TPA: type II toxin-antitoxin system VapC family toxin, partial [Thermoanaerobaculia bacterium]|nr:type II toxin-antitoxin system VapC family toxin [Thermoanaerobaculia bacterium]
MAIADSLGPYLLDANIVMYAVGRDHPLREPCRRALALAREEKLRLVVSTEVLQEILHRYHRISRLDLAEAAYSALKELSDDVLVVDERDLDGALALLREHPRLTARDAVHAATVRNRSLAGVLSTDRHFDGLEGLARLDPASLEPA